MSAMERSLRQALEAGDANDPAFREAIYSASERALERMIEQKPVDEATAHAQRVRLAETINRVEDDFYERQSDAGLAEDGPAQYDPALSLDPAYADAHGYATRPHNTDMPQTGEAAKRDRDFALEPVFDPSASSGSHPQAVAMEVVATAAGGNGDPVTEPIRPSPRMRGRDAGRAAARRTGAQALRVALVAVVVAIVLGVGLYFVYAAGTLSGGNEPRRAAAVELFDGRRLDVIAAPNGGRVEALRSDLGSAVRFTSASDAARLDVVIGPGVFPMLEGGKFRVEMTVGSPDGTERAFAVRCMFGLADVCRAQRFATSLARQTFAFDLDAPAAVADARLQLDALPSAANGAIDLYAVRLLERQG